MKGNISIRSHVSNRSSINWDHYICPLPWGNEFLSMIQTRPNGLSSKRIVSQFEKYWLNWSEAPHPWWLISMFMAWPFFPRQAIWVSHLSIWPPRSTHDRSREGRLLFFVPKDISIGINNLMGLSYFRVMIAPKTNSSRLRNTRIRKKGIVCQTFFSSNEMRSIDCTKH